MNVQWWLANAQRQLEQATIPTGRLDALVLLEAVSGKDRAHLLAHPELEIPKEQLNVLSGLLARREQHEPIAYLLGTCEFYGRQFMVSPAVLQPRPESETIIELLKAYAVDHGATAGWKIADVGTGSGALGISAKLELPEAAVTLIDIDTAALEIANMNVIKHTTGMNLILSDLLPQQALYDVLLCNLPYIPDNFNINLAATFEPKIALFGGADGLDLYRKLFQQVATLAAKPLLILTEALPAQHEELRTIAGRAGYFEDRCDDFVQAFRA